MKKYLEHPRGSGRLWVYKVAPIDATDSPITLLDEMMARVIQLEFEILFLKLELKNLKEPPSETVPL